MINIIKNLETLLAEGNDTALLRFGLANAYFTQGQFVKALEHAHCALQLDPNYSAAWKLYGKALTELGDIGTAIDAYQNGIVVAENKGDVQAAKEMRVFLKRLQKDFL